MWTGKGKVDKLFVYHSKMPNSYLFPILKKIEFTGGCKNVYVTKYRGGNQKYVHLINRMLPIQIENISF